jgi:hypothetical protein
MEDQTSICALSSGRRSSNTYEGVLFHDDGDIDKIFPTITKSITNKALTSNVATLTTAAAHGLAVGFEVADYRRRCYLQWYLYHHSSYLPTTTFTYAKTASNVTSTPASPTGTVTSEIEHFVDYAGGGAYRVYAMCDDGVYVYWITLIDDAGTDKTAMYKRPIGF